MSNNLPLLDASALCAFIFNEKGANVVEEALRSGTCMTTINISEVITKMLREGFVPAETDILSLFRITPISIDYAIALRAAHLSLHTHKLGLSLGDRVCLAAAAIHGHTVFSADQQWKKLKLNDISIKFIR